MPWALTCLGIVGTAVVEQHLVEGDGARLRALGAQGSRESDAGHRARLPDLAWARRQHEAPRAPSLTPLPPRYPLQPPRPAATPRDPSVATPSVSLTSPHRVPAAPQPPSALCLSVPAQTALCSHRSPSSSPDAPRPPRSSLHPKPQTPSPSHTSLSRQPCRKEEEGLLQGQLGAGPPGMGSSHTCTVRTHGEGAEPYRGGPRDPALRPCQGARRGQEGPSRPWGQQVQGGRGGLEGGGH